jgi:branched-chain amino acid transport system ATP-binding protein
MLEVRGLETAYGQSQVLFGVSLEIAPSQVVSLLGRNGMGKTTTVRSIMGITPSRSGTILFEGKPIERLASYRVAQAGIGLVPEGPPGVSEPDRAREPRRHRAQGDRGTWSACSICSDT